MAEEFQGLKFYPKGTFGNTGPRTKGVTLFVKKKGKRTTRHLFTFPPDLPEAADIVAAQAFNVYVGDLNGTKVLAFRQAANGGRKLFKHPFRCQGSIPDEAIEDINLKPGQYQAGKLWREHGCLFIDVTSLKKVR